MNDRIKLQNAKDRLLNPTTSRIGLWRRGRAFKKIRKLATRGDIEAQEALCRAVIELGDAMAREVTVTKGYIPQDRQQQVLFYFLTEQWKKYEMLDPDRNLLRSEYETGPKDLRQRIAETAGQAKWLEWVEVIFEVRRQQCPEELTEAEWSTAITLLEQSQQWVDLLHLALEAPQKEQQRIAGMARQ